MNEKKLRVAKPILIGMTLATILWVSAGSLTPPAGPITPTMKDLGTVEPRIPISPTTTPGDATSLFRIDQTGSYYLTGTINGETGKHGIDVAGGIVSLDLNGFSLLGVPGSGDGIRGAGRVVNGWVAGWGGVGVISTNYSQIDSVRVLNNAGGGIQTGSLSFIRNCVADNNGGTAGFVVSNVSHIEHCSANQNAGDGIFTGPEVSVIGCTAKGNAGTGIRTAGWYGRIVDSMALYNQGIGIQADLGWIIRGCLVAQNQSDGIQATTSCSIIDNRVMDQGPPGNGAGIHVLSGGSRIEANDVVDNDRGIEVDGDANLIIANSFNNNGTNLDVVAGNVVGPTVTGATVVGNSNPHSNYQKWP